MPPHVSILHHRAAGRTGYHGRMRRPIAPAAALLALALAPSPAVAAPHALGLNVHQSTMVGLDAARDAHMGWVRIDLDWLDAEPSQGAYDWTLFDSIVDGATSRGLQVLAVLAYTPAWASSGDTKADGSNNDIPKPGTYAAFVTATVQHFQGKVTHYEIWNEPNLDQFFEGMPGDYVSQILIPGADAVHAACPTCVVVAPGLASVGGMYDVWMDAALAAAKDKIDVVSGHVYAPFPMDNPGAGSSGDSFFNKLESHRVLYVGSNVLYEGPLSYKEVMDKHGVTKPFWLTETGLEAAAGDSSALAAQALFYRHVMDAMLWRPWWETTLFYEGFDEPGTGYTWGVVVDDPMAQSGYDPKPVFSLLAKAASSQPAFGGKGDDCNDGLDNDLDGLVDYPADPDCTSLLAKSEGLPPPDGGVTGGGGTGGTAGEGGGGRGTGGRAGQAKPSSGGCAWSAGGLDGGEGVVLGALAATLLVLRGTRRGRRRR